MAKKLRSVIISDGSGTCSIQDCFCELSDFPEHEYTKYYFHNKSVKVIVDIRIVSVDYSKGVVIEGWDYDRIGKMRIELHE